VDAQQIRVLIADDEPGMRMVIRKILERTEGFELVGEAENGAQLIELFEKTRPKVVIMDIEMPEMTGLECARIIQDRDPRVVLIFATAHEKYMPDAFEVYAFDYLLKPFKVDRAMKTLALVRERLTAPAQAVKAVAPAVQSIAGSRLMVKHREGVSFLDLNELILVQREDRSTVFIGRGGTRYVSSMALNELMEKLPPGAFLRTHKSYIVNVNFIDSILPYGRWTYIVKLREIKEDALITHEKFLELQSAFE
jgi:two-component system LytT family response regulator